MASTMILTGQGVVITSNANGSPNFIPMTGWVDASEILKVRHTLEMRGNSGSAQIEGAYQTSQDMISVDTAAAINATQGYLTAEGFQYPTGGFTDLSSTFAGKRKVRFGLLCQPGTGVTICHGCWAAITVECQGP